MFEDDIDQNEGEDAFSIECPRCGYHTHEDAKECEECGYKPWPPEER